MALFFPTSDELASTDYSPTAFSPRPDAVKAAVALLAVAGLAGLWKGVAYSLNEAAPPPMVAETSVSTNATAAKPLPALGATADTLIPPQADRPPAPVPAPKAAAAPAPPPTQVEAAAVEPSAMPVESAPASEAPSDLDLAEPDAAPADDFGPPDSEPLDEE